MTQRPFVILDRDGTIIVERILSARRNDRRSSQPGEDVSPRRVCSHLLESADTQRQPAENP
jgi:hypothetical protein